MTDIADACCPNADIETILVGLRDENPNTVTQLEMLIVQYPGDARLHFLRGSLLAGGGRAIEAHAAFSRAVALAPDYTLARFQLGFFELTSGEPARARLTWGPLATQLPDSHYLVRFADGLRHLIDDRFELAIRELETGIAANEENPPLNDDMRLIISECRKQLGPSGDEEAASATSLLLGQFTARGPLH